MKKNETEDAFGDHPPLTLVGLGPKAPWLEARGGRVMSEHTLLYLVKGHGWFKDAKTPRRSVQAGDLLVLHPGRWHCYDPDPGSTWTEYWMTFDGKEVTRRYGSILPGPDSVYAPGVDPRLLTSFENLQMVWLHRPAHGAPLMDFFLHEILMLFYMRIHGISLGQKRGLHDRTKAYLAAHLGDHHLDLEVFCRKEGLTYDQLRRGFKQESGMSPVTYLKWLRLNRAKELLLHTDATVASVAEQCGLPDINYFCRFFRKSEGMAPGAFRDHHQPRRMRGAVAPP